MSSRATGSRDAEKEISRVAGLKCELFRMRQF